MTVIEARVHRSSARNARVAFILTAVVVGVLAAVVAASYWHPIVALIVGALVGVPCGAAAWLLVRIWPVLRLLWWWITEVLLAVLLLTGWVQLAGHTPMVVTLLVVALVVGVPAAVPVIRRQVIAWAWCLVVRHRLRVCFAQFIIANQSGSLPLILWARPTPVGERVWVYLRPGLSAKDLEGRLDKIAVTCHASTVLIERAAENNAAYLRFDIKRREVLTAHVGSPLVDQIDPTAPVSASPLTVPTALDLPDVDAPTITLPAQGKPAGKKPAPTTSANGSKPAASSSAPEDDVSDWI
ncbi:MULTISPECIES: hypothetical protein [Micromonospora]|uniref:Uncharacterized protein n=1 Tax=Micromonospora solifontis TaxID=2487138 RepID=A0ABX9WQ58_9ACTN|nr:MULTISPECIES: hypothetical protein [Micromonospora]NES13270.1 hypothetical protein [Micromonospora sp. PPF5-17B]NES34639.1 hypothetical protein [Micromonospora solifontis]NES56997.1 hypothetical protein [Micromonospora sp. PPF5-6]RNM01882.1 hypothetical protein EFE23_00440 [Micromonospora solifontis]